MLEFVIKPYVEEYAIYNPIRLAVYTFLSLFGGANFIYNKFLEPLLKSNETLIDETIEGTWSWASSTANIVISATFKFIAR